MTQAWTTKPAASRRARKPFVPFEYLRVFRGPKALRSRSQIT
jgi:hypothetical protein